MLVRRRKNRDGSVEVVKTHLRGMSVKDAMKYMAEDPKKLFDGTYSRQESQPINLTQYNIT